MMCLVSALTVLVSSNASEKRTTDGSQTWENHVAEKRSSTGSKERVHAAALLFLNVFASHVAIPASASTATTAAAAVSPLVVFVIIALVVFIFAAAID